MRRKNIRLKDFDYKNDGYYFVTICTNYRKPYLQYDTIYKVVVAELARLENRFPGLKIDYFILMPTHAHIIFILENSSYPLNKIIQAFKSITTVKAKQALQLQSGERLWQPNYYEHIIRKEKSLYVIRKYIQENREKERINLESIS